MRLKFHIVSMRRLSKITAGGWYTKNPPTAILDAAHKKYTRHCLVLHGRWAQCQLA